MHHTVEFEPYTKFVLVYIRKEEEKVLLSTLALASHDHDINMAKDPR